MTRREETRCSLAMWLGVLVAGLLIAGCQTTSSKEELMKGGVPKEATLVGQGPGFVYRVPSDGRVYVASGKKVVNMRLVRGGDMFYSLGPAPGEDESIDYKSYEYYFEPVKMK